MRATFSILLAAAFAAGVACGSRTGLLVGGQEPRDGEADSSAIESGPPDGGALDAAEDDARVDLDAAPCVETIPFAETGPPIRCQGEHQDMTCWGGTQYCYSIGGGPPPGFSSAKCLPLPCACEGRIGCGCVDASPSQGCFCREEEGGVVVGCSVP